MLLNTNEIKDTSSLYNTIKTASNWFFPIQNLNFFFYKLRKLRKLHILLTELLIANANKIFKALEGFYFTLK